VAFCGTRGGFGCRSAVATSRLRLPSEPSIVLDGASDDDASRLSGYGERASWWDVTDSVEDSELKFIERLRRHDERAFNELVETYEQRVFRLVFRMLGRRDEAEDMAQEVFVQVFKAIATFRGDSKLSTWVYRIAVNLCKNRLKYLSRRHDGTQQELEPVAERAPLSEAKGVTFGDVARPDHMVEGLQVEKIVHACITELDPDFREVLILADVEDLSYQEIAQITGLADGTVKSRIHRARAMLKTKVERALGEKIR
jgi:RNA polymerase sigma-70 factor (ECF subfamily)